MGDKPSPVFQADGKNKNNKYRESAVARKYAIKNGVEPENILIEKQSDITEENIFFAVQIMKKNNMSTAILVSDPLHMKRAMLVAKYKKLVAYSSPTPTTRYKTLKTKLPFLTQEISSYIKYKITKMFF